MDLVRRILLELEKMPEAEFSTTTFYMDGVDDELTNYHIQLLVDAGLIHHEKEESPALPARVYISRYRLSWQGHEFLDLMKQDTNWKHAKEVMAKTGGMAFEILIKILLQYAAGQVGLV